MTGNVVVAGVAIKYWPVAGTDTTGGSPIVLNAGISQLQASDDDKMSHDYFWPNGAYDESRYIEFDFSNQTRTISNKYKIKSAKIYLEFNTINIPLGGAKIEVFDETGSMHEHTLLMPDVEVDLGQTVDISSYINSRGKVRSVKVRFLAFSSGAAMTLFDEVRLDVDIKKKEEEKKATPRKITNSKSKVSQGSTLIQRGSHFSKNSQVKVYFSRIGGQFYEPQVIKTTKSGSFIASYTVNKPKGTYKWYAVDVKTGKKSKTISYTVR